MWLNRVTGQTYKDRKQAKQELGTSQFRKMFNKYQIVLITEDYIRDITQKFQMGKNETASE